MIALPRLKIERRAILTCHTVPLPGELEGTEESGMNGGFLPCGVVSIKLELLQREAAESGTNCVTFLGSKYDNLYS